MKIASIDMTRTCFLGGQWYGHRVQSYLRRFTSAVDYAEDFDEFEAVVEDFIKFSPYIHYDPDTERIVGVTNDRVLHVVDPDGSMWRITGLDVMKMRMPDGETLHEWYLEYTNARPERATTAGVLDSFV